MVSIDDIKLPPHNIEAEKGVICSVLLDNEVLYVIEGFSVGPEDFYQKEHQIIFEGVLELWNSRKTIDVITLSDVLKKMGELDNIGGIDYLYDLSTYVFTPTMASDYAKIVKEKSVLRNILKTAQNIIGEVYDEKDINEILNKIEKQIFDLTQVNVSDSLVHIKDILNQRVENYMDIVDNPTKIDKDKILSTYKKLDDLTGGFKPGELIILAARPSMGKTSFMLNLAINAALRQGKAIALFSLEMGSEAIADRIISTVSEISMWKMHKGQLGEDDFARIGDAMEKLSQANIYIDDKGGYTVSEVRSKLRRLKVEKGNLDLAIIDYLQLMHSPKFSGNKVQEIGEISRGLKELARELNIPIIALSQLSRLVEQRPDKKPQLSDLRESGAIEQDADMVIMLYREDYYDPDTERKKVADVLVRKNRNGPTGEVELYFEKSIMKFFDTTEKDFE